MFSLGLTYRCSGYRNLFEISEKKFATKAPYSCPTNVTLSGLSTFTWQPMSITGQPAGALNPNEARGTFDYVASLDRIYYWTQDATTNALWIFDLGTSSWSQPSVALPSCSKAFSTKLNPLNDHILIFCGVNTSNVFTDQVLDFDPVTLQYSVLSTGTLPTRHSMAIAWDCNRKRYMAFGGCNSATLCNVPQTLQDTWVFDPQTAGWQNMNPIGSPSVRYGAVVDYDPLNDRYVLYGGATGNGGTLRSDTCIYDPLLNSWSCSTPANSPSCIGYENSFLWLPSLGEFLHFAGRGAGAACNDLKKFNAQPNVYSILSQANVPAARGAHGAIYDERRNRMVIYGGRDTVGVCNPKCFDMHELPF